MYASLIFRKCQRHDIRTCSSYRAPKASNNEVRCLLIVAKLTSRALCVVCEICVTSTNRGVSTNDLRLRSPKQRPTKELRKSVPLNKTAQLHCLIQARGLVVVQLELWDRIHWWAFSKYIKPHTKRFFSCRICSAYTSHHLRCSKTRQTSSLSLQLLLCLPLTRLWCGSCGGRLRSSCKTP